MSTRRVVTNVAYYFCVTMKPNGQKNDVLCEYTRGAPEPSLLQILIDIKPTNRDYFCICGT